MKPIAVIDTETDPFKLGRIPEPFIAGFYTFIGGTELYKEFYTMDALADYMEGWDGYVYAHNGGKFDYHFMLHRIDPFKPLKIINGRLAEFRCGRAICRDSYNILPVALSKMQKDDFEYWKMEKDVRADYMDEIREYLYHDCKYLYDFVSRYIDAYGPNITLASGALKYWRDVIEMGKRDIPKTGPDFYDSFKPYYYGGRVTPFKSGIFTGNFTVVDINSAYPDKMRDEHPWGSITEVTKHIPDSKMNLAFLDVECVSYGALPKRTKVGGVGFPDDGIRRLYRITGHEFVAALETGTIEDVEIKRGEIFASSINFQDYVNHFYDLKKITPKDDPNYLFYKLHLNSLYGKWAANPREYKDYRLGDFGEKIDGYESGSILGEYQLFHKPIDEAKQRWYNVATAASITGAVRAFLWRSICQVDTPYYCDTDSIICENVGNLSIGEELGQWDIEGNPDKLAIAGPKLYATWENGKATKERSKGVRLTASEIEKIAADPSAYVRYESDSPTFSVSNGVKFMSRIVKNTCNRPKVYV